MALAEPPLTNGSINFDTLVPWLKVNTTTY